MTRFQAVKKVVGFSLDNRASQKKQAQKVQLFNQLKKD